MTPFIKPLLLALLAGGIGLSLPAQAFDFKDLENLEAAEQQELLELARRAAAQHDFNQARSYIEQARHKGSNPQAIEAAETDYRRAYAAHQEQKRREEAERQARIEAERRAAQRTSSSGGGGLYIVSGLGGSFSGRCSGYKEYARHTVRFSNDSFGTVNVDCQSSCWNVAIYGSVWRGPATNCGDFRQDSWHARGDVFYRHSATLEDVANWLLGN